MLNIPRWKLVLFLIISLTGVLYAFPNMLSNTARQQLATYAPFVPHKAVNLGLDLRGGCQLLLQVEIEKVMQERTAQLASDVRSKLTAQRIGYSGGLRVVDGALKISLRDSSQQEKARAALAKDMPGVEIELPTADSLLLRYSEADRLEQTAKLVDNSIGVVRKRVDNTGTTEPTIQAQGKDRILVQVPGSSDCNRLKNLLGKTASLSIHLVEDTNASILSGSSTARVLTDKSGNKISISRTPIVTGSNLKDASVGYDTDGVVAINFSFDSIGARRFAEATRKNVTKNMAIILDDDVLVNAEIREPITGGRGQITGQYTPASAADVVNLLKAGALPAPLTVLEERSVGPSLGSDSVKAGQISLGMSLVIVVGFMIFAYGIFGLWASVAVILNLIFLFGIMGLMQATLSLPGIAGVVLTLGMAVDANVLIFERIREEIGLGRKPLEAIDLGYNRAMGTIIDSNITTLIAALCLYMLGSGPVRGFGITLVIGIVTSMFTSISLTRVMVVAWFRHVRPSVLPI